MNFALALLLCLPVSTWRMKVTAYDPGCVECCGKWAGNMKTSTGKDASLPGCAADPRVLRYGSIIDIPGYGVVEIDDTGGAMRQDAKRQIIHIDIRMQSHEAARAWGVQWLDVDIVKYARKGK